MPAIAFDTDSAARSAGIGWGRAFTGRLIDRASQFRKHAQTSRELAEQAACETTREALREMAVHWDALGDALAALLEHMRAGEPRDAT